MKTGALWSQEDHHHHADGNQEPPTESSCANNTGQRVQSSSVGRKGAAIPSGTTMAPANAFNIIYCTFCDLSLPNEARPPQ